MRKRIGEANQNSISILALDDDYSITMSLQSFFQSSGYKVDIANDPVDAIDQVRQNAYDILLLDFFMAPLCGDEVVAKIREFNTELFIVLLTGHSDMAPPIQTMRQLDIQGYCEKTGNYDNIQILVESCVKSINLMRKVKSQNEDLVKTNEKLNESYTQLVKALRLAVDARDDYTRGHSDRVAYYARRLAKALGKDETYCEKVYLGGLFHDVGKLNIPDSILLKDSRLTDEEYAVIKTHPLIGYEILSQISYFENMLCMARNHHERWDGKGYPDKLDSDNIPEEARIVSIADSFDAMTSTRHYRKAHDLDFAISELKAGKFTQFDGNMIDVFIKELDDYESMKNELAWTYGVQDS